MANLRAPEAVSGSDGQPRICILVVAYNAESTLRATLDRVPTEFRKRIAEVIVLDKLPLLGSVKVDQIAVQKFVREQAAAKAAAAE